MDYPRLAPQWRTQPVAAQEPGLAAVGRPYSAALLRGFNEPTESRDELTKNRRADPEPTEEILAEIESAGGASAQERRVRPGNGDAKAVEITHPIAVSQPVPGGQSTIAALASPVHVHLASDDDDPAELVELVVEKLPRRSSVESGQTLAGRYVVMEQISDCGMGVVYKALDRRREKAGSPVPWVALKFAGAPGAARYLREEFLKLSQLNHPNIVSVFDFDSDGGLEFVVMEWLEGETLASLLARINSKRIALDKAQAIIRSVGEALSHAHDLGIVHGDVKPSNVLLTDSRSVKLLDFGSAAFASGDGRDAPFWATRAYASCDVLRGEVPRPGDDVFALGVTAYCLLAGVRPFGDLDACEAKARGLVPARLPADAQETWPAVARALSLDAVYRHANAGEFLLEFCDLAADGKEVPQRSPLENIIYGAMAVAFLLALVVWSVGSVSGLTADAQSALENAETALADGRLVEPRGDNAWSFYSSVLAVAPDHAGALDGLSAIAEEFLTRARQALANHDVTAAADHLAVARRVMPGHYGIAVMEDLIARYGRDLVTTARQVSRSDPERAERLLARAQAFLPEDDRTVAALRTELEQQRIDARLEMLLSGIDERILAERLTVPQDDSAIDLLRRARALAPDDRQVAVAADRIATALLFQSMFAVSSGQLDEAEAFIDAARALDVQHLALARARYELAKARHAAVRRQGRRD